MFDETAQNFALHFLEISSDSEVSLDVFFNFYNSICMSVVKNIPTKNWICRETFDSLLKYCFTMYKIMSSRKVETEYKIIKDAGTVESDCKNRSMTFWLPDDSSSERDEWRKVTIDVQMFLCPMTKMDLKFPKADNPPEVRDFYVTEGRNKGTVAVLRNSTSCDNVCLAKVFRPADDFKKEIF